MQDYIDSSRVNHSEAMPPQRLRAIWWIPGALLAVPIFGCCGIMAFFGYVGAVGPDTSVYTANRIPQRFMDTIDDVGALDEDEKILYFYSDAMTDILDGFYFVSDKKVVIYSHSFGDEPLTAIAFDDIVDADLYRDESFFDDSEITLYLKDDQVLSFPVSSDSDRDQQFFDAIYEKIKTEAADI
jgi:hypothetical protein